MNLLDSLIIHQTELKNNIFEINPSMTKDQMIGALLVKKEKIYKIIKKEKE